MKHPAVVRRAVLLLSLAGGTAVRSLEGQATLGYLPTYDLYSYGYGGPNLLVFSAALNAAFAGTNHVVMLPGLNGSLGGTTSLMLELQAVGTYFTGFTATQSAKLSTFIASGRRMVIFGDNYAWPSWNNAIASLVGGTYIPQNPCSWSYSGPAVNTALTAGVTTVRPACASYLAGGQQLFADPYIHLWGSTANVLTIMDVNTCDDAHIGVADNGVFCSNVATWLATPPPPPPVIDPADPTSVTPEPTAILLMASGLGLLAGAGLVRRRR